MKFEDLSLDARILEGVQAAGFTVPTPIQEEAIPHILEGRDVLGLAQTGTGKTAAFMLPILQRLTQGQLRKTRALVVAPTRELAEQIHDTAIQLGRKTKIRSTSIYGGVGKGQQISAIRSGIEIVVACPGRLLDHINEGNINLSNIEVLVLDEADRMFDMGFLPDIRRLIKQLPQNRQNLFFSATMPKDIRKLADEILHDPVTVQIGLIAPAKTVSHALYPVPQGKKKGLLLSMLKGFETDKVLIFTRTKRRARFLAQDLEGEGYKASALQGNMAQNRRQEAINGFRGNKYDILVATDIAARGIDVAEISHVINFDMPDTVDAYTHRIGRTGRAQQLGEAVTFVSEDDEIMVRDIERTLGKKIERRQLESFDYNSRNDLVSNRDTKPPQGQNQGRAGSGRSGNQNGNSQPRRANGESSRSSSNQNGGPRNGSGRTGGGQNSSGSNNGRPNNGGRSGGNGNGQGSGQRAYAGVSSPRSGDSNNRVANNNRTTSGGADSASTSEKRTPRPDHMASHNPQARPERSARPEGRSEVRHDRVAERRRHSSGPRPEETGNGRTRAPYEERPGRAGEGNEYPTSQNRSGSSTHQDRDNQDRANTSESNGRANENHNRTNVPAGLSNSQPAKKRVRLPKRRTKTTS